MTEFINVVNRDQFDDCLNRLERDDIVVVDTETNGLRYYRDNYIISISLYFPAVDEAYNLAFRHGQGVVDVSYNSSNPEDTDFEDMNWSGSTKNQVYLDYWYQKFAEANPDYHENLPIGWLDELKVVWGRDWQTYVFHNAPFDLHMLEADGFPRPHEVEDTMVLLHLVNEDWQGVRVDAPFTWTNADVRRKACLSGQVGMWARDAGGNLITKEQNGNRQLKWQCAFLGIEDATKGEEELFAAKIRFEETLTDFIMSHLDDPMNVGLVYASIEKADTEAKAQKAWEQYGDKQRERIRSKVQLDSKANMWMLRASETAYYAMLDVVLTWKLRQTWMPIIKQWENVRLYHQQCDVLYKVAWQMERNGVLLDEQRAQEEIERLDPQVEATQQAFNDIAHTIGYGQDVNIGSWQQLLAYFRWTNAAGQAPLEIPMDKTVFPDFMTGERVAGLRAYDYARPSSTAHAMLENYEDHPIVRLIFEYRKMKKSSDTYLKRWIGAVDGKGYVHGGMNSTGTVAGRWSSSGEAGNWQNIPDRNGYQIKKAIIAPEDWCFFAIDYGQLEARLAAWIGEILLREQGVHNLEPIMTNLFLQGVDMHAYTRDIIGVRDIVFGTMTDNEIHVKLGYDSDDAGKPSVDKICRQIAKTLNFGLLYNGSEYMASSLLKIELEVAKVLVDKWRALFPAFAIAQQHFAKQALEWRKNPSGDGYGMYVTQPISNRHRKLHKYPKWVWFYEDGVRKGFNPQTASADKTWNNIVQGLGGYICTTSALYINRKYGEDKLRMFANIHDALDGYVHKDHLYIVRDMLEIMTDWDTMPRLTVDLEGSIDGTWQGMTHVENIDIWISSKGKEGY